jgi:hypothetical protein
MSYNGWSNRATWNVSLWLSNDEPLYHELQSVIRRASDVEDLAEKIEELAKAVWPNGKTPDGDKIADADFAEIAESEWRDSDRAGEDADKDDPSEATRQNIKTFAESNGLLFTAHRVNERPDGLGASMTRHFRCSIINQNNGKAMSLYFSQGSAHVKAPTLEDVLDCLASDAASIENSKPSDEHPRAIYSDTAFENWATEFGYDPDSRKAEKMYKATRRQAEQLKRTIGPEAYDQLLWHTERL